MPSYLQYLDKILNEEKVSIPEGYIEYSIIFDTLFIEKMLIKPNKQGKGYGTKLVNDIIELAKNKKLKYIEVQAVPIDETTQYTDLLKFYKKKFGFKKIDDVTAGLEGKGEKIGEHLQLKLK